MKIFIILFVFSFVSIFLFGQTTKINSKLIVTDYTYSSKNEFDDYISGNSKLIKDSNEKTVIRFIYKGQVVTIFSRNDNIFHANIINYVRQYKIDEIGNKYFKHKSNYRYLFQQINVDDSIVAKVIRGIFNTNLLEISADSSLEKNSISGFFPWDELIFLEFKTKEGKHCKQILNRKLMLVSKQEVNLLVKVNFDQIMSLFNLDLIYTHFLTELPNEKNYSINGIGFFYKNANGEIRKSNYYNLPTK